MVQENCTYHIIKSKFTQHSRLCLVRYHCLRHISLFARNQWADACVTCRFVEIVRQDGSQREQQRTIGDVGALVSNNVQQSADRLHSSARQVMLNRVWAIDKWRQLIGAQVTFSCNISLSITHVKHTTGIRTFHSKWRSPLEFHSR